MSDTEDTLAKYDGIFQSKCVVALLTDKNFLEQTIDIIEPAFFESEALAWIVEKIFWYYNTYRNQPTLEVFKTEINKLPDYQDVLKASIKENLKVVYRNKDADDATYIKKEFLEFCKNHALKNAILKSVDALQRGKYDEIKMLVDKASRAGIAKNMGHNWVEDFDARITKESRNTIPTRWDVINDLLNGGLGAGELACIVGASGTGKSWVLQDIGQYACSLGKSVVHYTLELAEGATALRYDSIMTGFDWKQIENRSEETRAELKRMPGNVFVKWLPAHGVNTNAISADINHRIMLGHKPDLLIVDYADLMHSVTAAAQRHEALGYVYEELRAILGEFAIPGWTASQSGRASLEDEIIEAGRIAGSYEKIMKCDFVISFSRKAEDKVANTGRFYCIKNRFGPDGITFPAHLDYSKGEIFIYDGNSPEGVAITQRTSANADKANKLFHNKMLDTLKSRPALSLVTGEK